MSTVVYPNSLLHYIFNQFEIRLPVIPCSDHFHWVKGYWNNNALQLQARKIFLPPTKAATANCFGFFRLKYNLLGGCTACRQAGRHRGCITKGFNYSCRVATTAMPHTHTHAYTAMCVYVDVFLQYITCECIIHFGIKTKRGSLVGLLIVFDGFDKLSHTHTLNELCV